jgi:hypothetical protein
MESYNSRIKNTEPLHDDYLTASLGGSWTKLILMEFTNEGEHYSTTELATSYTFTTTSPLRGTKRQRKDSNSSPKKTSKHSTKRTMR